MHIPLKDHGDSLRRSFSPKSFRDKLHPCRLGDLRSAPARERRKAGLRRELRPAATRPFSAPLTPGARRPTAARRPVFSPAKTGPTVDDQALSTPLQAGSRRGSTTSISSRGSSIEYGLPFPIS
jgi:hypothetical protein